MASVLQGKRLKNQGKIESITNHFVHHYRISSLRSDIPARLRRGRAKAQEKSSSNKFGCFFCTLAERQGFEPWEQLPVHRISSAARSTTPASLQYV